MTCPDKMFEAHWEYTARVIEWTLKLKNVPEDEINRILDFARNLYIPALAHGYKHAINESQKSKGDENNGK